MANSLTAAVLTYNEADMIEACLSTLSWCKEILVLDTGSSDETVALASSLGARVVSSTESSFAARRNALLAECKTDWILYIDADERVTPELAGQIEQTIEENVAQVISFPRRNYFFGEQFAHGGWQGEIVTRAFAVRSLKGWHGTIHESPDFEGTVKRLSAPLWHFSHRSVKDGLEKTAAWTPMEATLLAESGVASVSAGTVLRKGLGEIWRRGVLQSGWKDGTAGRIEVLIQAINRMLVYMQVWELQKKPTIAEHYDELEKQIESLWQQKT